MSLNTLPALAFLKKISTHKLASADLIGRIGGVSFIKYPEPLVTSGFLLLVEPF